MNEMPIQIRNLEVVRAIRELAEATGRPLTEAVGEAVRSALASRQSAEQQRVEERRASIQAVVEEFRGLPRIGPLLTDDDFYDKDGMPK